jgi:hypothetical protein
LQVFLHWFQVKVSLEDKQAVIRYLSEKWNEDALTSRIEDMGFGAERVKQKSSSAPGFLTKDTHSILKS